MYFDEIIASLHVLHSSFFVTHCVVLFLFCSAIVMRQPKN